MMRDVLVCGGAGQIGQELARQVWHSGLRVHFPHRSCLDVSDSAQIAAMLDAPGRRWACVINCAAYTDVDKAEAEVAEAFLVNAQGPARLAEACRQHDLPMIHLSTDYVFNGRAPGYYAETDRAGPLSAYGASKLAGELAVQAANPRSIILRTAWVISAFGNNFLKSMLRLANGSGQAPPLVRVVNDQHGCPTGAGDVARTLVTLAVRMASDPGCPTGIFHFVNAGEATWFDLAHAVFQSRRDRGGAEVPVIPITTEEYPTVARRPANSRLSTARIRDVFGIQPRPWRGVVDGIMDELIPAPVSQSPKESTPL